MRRVVGILCVLAPFVAAAIAAAGARRDFRLAGMAIVSTATVWLLLKRTGHSFANGLVVFIAAAAAAIAVGVIAGARAPFGVIAVAIVVAGFAAAGQLLLRREKLGA